jgi:gliding motility-associated-like protein
LKFEKILGLVFFALLWIQKDSVKAQCVFESGPPGEICTSAKYICGSELDGYTGKLPEKNSAPQLWSGGICNGNGTAQNIIWFSFVPCSTSVTLELNVHSCYLYDFKKGLNAGTHPNAGVQVGLYSGCNKNKWLDCSQNPSSPPGVTGTFRVSSNQFVPGEIAYLYLDGFNVDLETITVCSFSVKVIHGIDTSPVAPPNPNSLTEGFITGQNTIACSEKNVPVTYSLTEPERAVNFSSACAPPNNFNPKDSICYAWSVTPSVGASFKDNKSTGKTTDIIFTEPGTYTINAETYFNPFYVGSCANVAAGKINSWTVTVLPPITVDEPIQYVCPGTSVTYCGKLITSDTIVICDSDPCRLLRKQFVVGTSKLNLLGTQYICDGGSFNFQNIAYNSAGSYSVQDLVDCSLEHKFTVEVISLSASIVPSALELNCNRNSIILNGIVQSNVSTGVSSKWLTSNGNVIENVATTVIDKSGKYVFEISYTSNGTTCADREEIDIISNFKKPEITAFLPIVRCLLPRDPKPIITIITNDNIINTQWTSPRNQKFNSLNVEVDSLNASTGLPYRLSLTGANGCILDTSFIINTNFTKADIKLQCDELTCYKPIALMTAVVNMSFDSIRWNKVDVGAQAFYGSHIDKISHMVTQEGTYQVDVLASSSKCWNKESLYVADVRVVPTLSIASNLPKWHCNTKSIEITPQASSTPQMEYQWSTPNGKILSNDTDLKLEVGSPGSYAINVLDKSNGCAKSGVLTITEETNKPTALNFTYENPLCFGESNGLVNINTAVGGFAPYTYYLNGQRLSTLNIDQLKSGVYNLEVRDIHECVYQSSFEIKEPQLFTVKSDESLTLVFNESTTLSFTSNYPNSDIDIIRWKDATGNVLGSDFDFDYTGLKSEEIFLEVYTINGCESRASIKISIDSELKFFVPNIFSPNGDGVNDRLEIFKNKIPANLDRVSIYDRMGNKVYDDINYATGINSDGWDGTFNQKPVQEGVYIMMLELTDYNGGKQIIKKDITIIR